MDVRLVSALDISHAAAYRRCKPGGPWQRLFPGVVLLHNGPPTRDQLVAGALLKAGPDALITGPEACRRYGLRLPGNEVHVLSPRRIQGAGYLVVLTSTKMPAAVQVDGFPLAPPARAVADACRTLKTDDDVTGLVAAAVQQGLCDPAHLAIEAAGFGTKDLRRLLKDLSQVRSVAERDARALSRKIGLTTKYWNRTIESPDGTVIGTPDAWFDDVGLAWEIDSKSFHLAPKDYARTLERNTRYARAGILVVQTLPARIRTEPDEVGRELKQAHQAAANRPRPPVRMT
ncbi:hypothetical protein Lesp02_25230 [Lentzea sp. NBRC 105346]|uniref:hypothetical protein n=1 Tax=Lentzea sp. NBRC 105346 TaxID=3032205 RepID=UPI002556E4D7|nr:hypothetical protein [Lentzea sp. NBRC 105346]GLZ30334.1 hypothetical protein Lesp02_25230 [Lentzea sp. NBRC 105346]